MIAYQPTKHFMFNLTMNLRCWDILSQTNIWAFSCIYTLHEVLLVTNIKGTGIGQSTYTIYIERKGCMQEEMKGDEAICIFVHQVSGNALGTITPLFHLILTILWGRWCNSFPFYRKHLITLSVAELGSEPRSDDKVKQPSFMRTCKSA